VRGGGGSAERCSAPEAKSKPKSKPRSKSRPKSKPKPKPKPKSRSKPKPKSKSKSKRGSRTDPDKNQSWTRLSFRVCIIPRYRTIRCSPAPPRPAPKNPCAPIICRRGARLGLRDPFCAMDGAKGAYMDVLAACPANPTVPPSTRNHRQSGFGSGPGSSCSSGCSFQLRLLKKTQITPPTQPRPQNTPAPARNSADAADRGRANAMQPDGPASRSPCAGRTRTPGAARAAPA